MPRARSTSRLRPKPIRAQLEIRVCSHCRAQYQPRTAAQRFCSAACRAAKMGWKKPPLSTTARGYGIEHVNERKKWATLVESGSCTCARCGQPIQPGTQWDLDHSEDRTYYLGAAHRTCNRRAGAIKGNQRAARRTEAGPWTSRTW